MAAVKDDLPDDATGLGYQIQRLWPVRTASGQHGESRLSDPEVVEASPWSNLSPSSHDKSNRQLERERERGEKCRFLLLMAGP